MTYLGLKGQPAVGPLQVVTDPNSVQLPLGAFYLSPSDQLTIFEAERAAEQACIHRYLPGVELGAYGRVLFVPTSLEPLPYLAPSQSARYGYHDPVVMALARQDNVPLHGPVLTEADEIDLGTVHSYNRQPVPAGGCSSVGTEAVTHGITPALAPTGFAHLATVSGVVKLIDFVTSNNSRVKTADAKWSACMASHGYYYARPQFAANNELWNRRITYGGYRNPITAVEIRTALADVACRSEANLYGVYWAVAAAYQREWMASPQNMAIAQTQEKADQVMLSRARGIIGG